MSSFFHHFYSIFNIRYGMDKEFDGKVRVRDYFAVSILLVCSVVGVGFISGAEIYQFFSRFKYGWMGVVIFAMLLFVLTRKILSDAYNKKCNKLQNFSKNDIKNTNLIKNRIKNGLIFADMLMVSSAMIAGLTNLLSKLFSEAKIYVFLAFVAVVFVLLCIGIKGIAKLDMVVCVFSVFFAVYMLIDVLGFGANVFIETGDYELSQRSASVVLPIVFAVLYVFMNIMSVQPVVNEYDKKMNKNQIVVLSIVFSAILTILLVIFMLFMNKNAFFAQYSMPFLEYFSRCDKWIFVIYVLGLFLALSASYLSCVVGVKRGIKWCVKNNVVASALSVILSLVFGMIDFSVYVSVIYPIIGVINIVIFALM